MANLKGIQESSSGSNNPSMIFNLNNESLMQKVPSLSSPGLNRLISITNKLNIMSLPGIAPQPQININSSKNEFALQEYVSDSRDHTRRGEEIFRLLESWIYEGYKYFTAQNGCDCSPTGFSDKCKDVIKKATDKLKNGIKRADENLKDVLDLGPNERGHVNRKKQMVTECENALKDVIRDCKEAGEELAEKLKEVIKTLNDQLNRFVDAVLSGLKEVAIAALEAMKRNMWLCLLLLLLVLLLGPAVALFCLCSPNTQSNSIDDFKTITQ